ncbi:MAG TPA: hypothetical protein VK578_16365 [Edaphobacter sp.]|nr:hypothetical protein [Edaphobacter sp.]
MAKTVTVVENQPERLWTPEKRIQFRIGIVRLWMQDCNDKTLEGRKVYSIFDVYVRSLQRQQIVSRPGNVEYAQMKSAIESIHELIDELEEENIMELHGWSFGQRPVNRAQGLMATLLVIRGELLHEITDLVTN